MHVLVSQLRDARHRAWIVALIRAFALPYRAARFVRRRRVLWPLVIAPACVNIVLFAGGVVLVVFYADSVAQLLWTRPEAAGGIDALLAGLWYVMYGVVFLLGLVAVYVGTLLVGGIVASPFNDVLGERVEQLLLEGADVETVERPLWREVITSVRSSAAIVGLYVLLMAPVLPLNLIPVVGSMMAAGLGVAIGAFFLALEYADGTLARRGFTFGEKIRLLRRHWPLAGGFGLSTSVLIWIPVLNILCIPIAVVGGTALALALVEHEGEDEGKSG